MDVAALNSQETLTLMPGERGFTLSELLISLSVLGLIAALTLPAIFNSVNKAKRSAIIKETLNAIQTAALEESSTTAASSDSFGFFRKHLNVKECTNTLPMLNPWNSEDYIGCVLHNGAWLKNLNNLDESLEVIHLDWNGDEGPNTFGEDRMLVTVNWGPAPRTEIWTGNSSASVHGTDHPEIKQGELIPWAGVHRTMYNDVYK